MSDSPKYSKKTRWMTQPRLWLFGIWSFVFGMSDFRGFYLPESDVLWEIRAGQDFIKIGDLPPHESFNWMLGQGTWIPNSWLWSALLGQVYNAAGIVGISLLVSVLSIGTLLLAWRLIRLSGIKHYLTQLIILLAFAISIFAWISGRPQQADFFIILLFYNVVYSVRRVSFVRRIAILTVTSYLFSMLWMNFHLSAIASVPFFTAGILFVYRSESVKRKIVSAAMIACASFLGTLATPFGITGLLKAEVVAQQSRNIIQEWLPLSTGSEVFIPVLSAIVLFGGILLLFSLLKKDWLFSLGLVVLALASLEATRFAPFLAVYALLGARNIPTVKLQAHKLISILVAILMTLILLSGIVFAGYQIGHPDGIPRINPSNFDHLPANARVLTMPDGGATILLYHQDAMVSLDGRNDIIGEKRYRAVIKLFSGSPETVNRWIGREQVTAVFVEGPNLYRMDSTMETLKWTKHVTSDGALYVKPGIKS